MKHKHAKIDCNEVPTRHRGDVVSWGMWGLSLSGSFALSLLIRGLGARAEARS